MVICKEINVVSESNDAIRECEKVFLSKFRRYALRQGRLVPDEVQKTVKGLKMHIKLMHLRTGRFRCRRCEFSANILNV